MGIKKIINNYFIILKDCVHNLWHEAQLPEQGWITDLVSKAYAKIPVILQNNRIMHVVKILFVCKRMLRLIRRDIMRVIRSNSVYIKAFNYMKKNIVYIAYAIICIIGWIALLSQGGLLMVIFIILGVVTTTYVQANMKKQEEDIIYMNIIMFYLNCSCILAFFLNMCEHLYSANEK